MGMLQEMKYLRERNKLLEQKLKNSQNSQKETEKNESTENVPKNNTNQETKPKSLKIVIDTRNSSIITEKST